MNYNAYVQANGNMPDAPAHRGLGTINPVKWGCGDRNQAQAQAQARRAQNQNQGNLELDANILQVLGGTAKHILVTGGAGYIGSHAAMRLLDDQIYAVTVLDNLSRGNVEAIEALRAEGRGRFAYYNVDLGHPDDVVDLLASIHAKHRIDAVIHFAGIAYVAESYSHPSLYYRNVTANTANLVNAMEKVGVHNIIFSSTCATYGNAKKMPITEATPQIPVSPYGSSKLMTEKIIIDQVQANPATFSAVILRYFNVIGADPRGRVGETPKPDLPSEYSRISGACFNVALGKNDHFSISGVNHPTSDGTCVRDYIHVMDLVDAHIRSFTLFKPGTTTTMNVGTGTGYSVREFAAACILATGKNISIVEGPGRDGDAAAVFADPTKVKSILGWRPQHVKLASSLETAWRWTVKQHRRLS